MDNVFAALNAALGAAPAERNAAQLKLQVYERDAVPGFLLSLLTICQQGGAVNEVRSLLQISLITCIALFGSGNVRGV